MKKILGWLLGSALLMGLAIPITPYALAKEQTRKVTYEEYLNMGYKTDVDDCYERSHDNRRARPSGSLGGYVYDYSDLPSPQDMIFVCINNKFLLTDVPIEVENGSTLIPMRALIEAIGGTISWDESMSTVTAVLDDQVIEMTVNKQTAKVNGAEVAMNVPSRKLRGRVYIPLRFVSEQLGRYVIWQPNSRIVKVMSYPEISVEVMPATAKVNSEDYNYGNFFSIARRYLLRQNGEIHWLQAWGRDIHIQIMDENLHKKGEVKLQEGMSFGGAHAGEDGNFYLVFGQGNREESDSKTIYRIVKYDQKWNRLAHVDVNDVYVIDPFDASNLTMDSHNGILVIHTARKRYLTEDGLNHQSNITIQIRMDDMTIIDKGGQWPRNHVSHSFANYVKFDGDRIVYLNHGDAYPRAVVLQVEEGQRITQKLEILAFPGEIGDNYTGGMVGGLEVSADRYLAVGTYKGRMYLAAVPKNAKTEKEMDFAYLTGDSSSVSETHIVKLNDDRFVLIWKDSASRHNVNYMVVDGHGKPVGKPRRFEGIASPGNIDPLVLGNKIIWYYQEFTYNKDEITEFYTFEMDV